jgi:ketosteroid isomerase-like protein
MEFTVKSLHSSAWLTSILFATVSMPVSAQESPEAVVKKRFEATANRNLDAIAALYASDAIETSPAFCAPRQGSGGARKTYGDLFRDAPGIENEVTNFVVEGNHVAVQFIARVRKPDGSIAFEVPLANFLTVERGRIVRDDTYFDTKGRPCS